MTRARSNKWTWPACISDGCNGAQVRPSNEMLLCNRLELNWLQIHSGISHTLERIQSRYSLTLLADSAKMKSIILL